MITRSRRFLPKMDARATIRLVLLLVVAAHAAFGWAGSICKPAAGSSTALCSCSNTSCCDSSAHQPGCCPAPCSLDIHLDPRVAWCDSSTACDDSIICALLCRGCSAGAGQLWSPWRLEQFRQSVELAEKAPEVPTPPSSAPDFQPPIRQAQLVSTTVWSGSLLSLFCIWTI